MTPFYVVLEAQRQTGSHIGVGQVLLAADSAIPDRSATLAELFMRRTGAALEFFSLSRGVVPSDAVDYKVGEDGRSHVLFSVRPVLPDQGAFKLDLEDRPLPGGMTIDLEPLEPDGDGRAKSWKVVVKIGEGLNEGRIGYPINLLSDRLIEGAPAQADGSPTVYTTTAMVSALVKGLISYNPLYLSYGLVRPGQIQSRTLRIECNDPDFDFPPDVATKIVAPGNVEQESPYAEHFSASVRPAADGKALDVELTLNGMPDGMNSSFQGKLVVVTGHPTKEQVEVLFSGVCRGAAAANPTVTKKPNPGAGEAPADAGDGK